LLVLAVPLGLNGAAFSGVGGLILFGVFPVVTAVLLLTGAAQPPVETEPEPPPVSASLG